MTYTVVVEPSPEGFAASVPSLPDCHSQGATEAEAIENVREAIREYRDVVDDLDVSSGAKRVAVEV